MLLLRRVFAPLRELTALMRRVDPLNPGRADRRPAVGGRGERAAGAFNEMLDRVEQERRTSGRRALAAQERERRRLARELHDELGQTLTGIVLLLDGIPGARPVDDAGVVEQVQEAARGGVEKMRDIARGLRPVALDEFGLRSALTTLAAGFAERTGLRVRNELADDLPVLAPEPDLAIYRTAQETLTNVVRHAEATAVALALDAVNGARRAVRGRRRARRRRGRAARRRRGGRDARTRDAGRRAPGVARAARGRDRSAAGGASNEPSH